VSARTRARPECHMHSCDTRLVVAVLSSHLAPPWRAQGHQLHRACTRNPKVQAFAAKGSEGPQRLGTPVGRPPHLEKAGKLKARRSSPVAASSCAHTQPRRSRARVAPCKSPAAPMACTSEQPRQALCAAHSVHATRSCARRPPRSSTSQTRRTPSCSLQTGARAWQRPVRSQRSPWLRRRRRLRPCQGARASGSSPA